MLSYRMQITAPDGPYHYVGSKTKRFIVWFVIAVHIGILVIPGLILGLIAWLKPDEVLVSKVVLVDSLPNDHKIPSRNPGDAPEPNNDNIALPPSDIPDIPEIKEVPAPQPPKPKPPVKKPERVQPKPPKPKPPVKKPERVQPKPKPQKKPAWKPLDAKDIKIQRTKRTGQKTEKQTPNRALTKLAGELRADAKAAGGAGGPMGKYSPDANDYYQRVGAFLRAKWIDQPDVSALGGQRPVVVVMFHISTSGRIISTRIQTPSGVAVMDASVQRFLRTLTRIPAPPDRRMTRFSVTLRIQD